MKKALRIVFIILLVCLIGITGYLGYRFFKLSSANNQVTREITYANNDLESINKEIDDLNNELKVLVEQNSNAYTEYTNWIRHNKKLEEILK